MKLELGQIVASRGAMKDFGLALIADLLDRHARGDWGDLCAFDRQQNSRALKTGARMLSAYETPAGRCWIIAKATDAGARPVDHRPHAGRTVRRAG